MATTTPNYGWPVPTSTDLVKDGAVAIESLGDAADATMATMVPKSIVDAKGDIIAATAADTVSRLAVGANDTVLTADSTAATGLKWATPSAGAAFSGAQARNSSSQSITNNTETAIIFDSEIFDSGTYWASGNNTRFTVPSTGKYSISVSVLFNYSVAGYQTIKIYKNGAFAYQVDRVGFTGTSSNAFSLGKTSLISLTASDYVQAFYYQNSGSTQTIFGNTSDTGCMQWSINYLGA